MNLVVTTKSSSTAVGRRIRVMIVDDAVVVRGLFSRWVQAESDLEVVASLRTGREAVNQVERADPDVVVLDVDMPELDGIAALPLLLKKKPDLVVIMASTLTRRNAEISLRALSLGATDYIPKPDNNREVTASISFRRDLIEKIRQLGLNSKRLRPVNLQAGTAVGERPTALAPKLRAGAQPIALRAPPATPPRVLVIGSSTGGPQALNVIVSKIGSVLDRAPVLITQHMPPTFTTILAEHLARLAERPVHEAREGEEVVPGTIYLAPGGRHMAVTRRDGTAKITLDDGPLVNFCKPAVDPLFTSAAKVWGNKLLGLVLTGMGSDGLRGSQAIAVAGGSILAQDEGTSVVWGMPGQVAHAGLCSAVLPLSEIAPRLTRLFGGDKT
ncbi:MAG: protein-glutamate methylesterase/protein-glutamine glutaminase [Pseudolabrys sp.]